MARTPLISIFAVGVLLSSCSSDSGEQQNPATAGTSATSDAAGSTPTAMTAGAGGATTSGAAGHSGASAAGSGSGAAGQTTAGASGAGAAGSTRAAAGAGAAGMSGAPAEAGAGGAAGAPGGAFEQCIAALKPVCGYEEKETACAALTTPKIPLTAGGEWGGLELKGGPYGGYVEWNEGMAFKNPVNPSEESCPILAATFGEPQSTTDDVLNLRGADLSLYTVFRPACMKDGEKYPVITWGNGTCGQSGGYASFLATVASYGFVVFASNSRFTDQGNNEMLRALDFAKAANEDPNSVFYQKLDLEKVGAMGHSQGGSATVNAAKDPRIKAIIIWNAGMSATKPFLAVSGERDITSATPATMASAIDAATLPAAWLFYHKILETGGNVTGHLTLMEQPERVWEPAVAWFKYQLLGDEEAKKMFVGETCGLCTKKDEFEFGSKNLQ